VYFVNNFETILARALKDELSREEALYIYLRKLIALKGI